jgi:hypothetical protein
MKVKLLSAIVVATVCFGARANAQTENLVRVQLTHEFLVGTTALPAGSYTIDRLDPNTSLLLIRNDLGQPSTLIVPLTFESQSEDAAKLTFIKTGDSYSLTKIDTAVGVFTFAEPRTTPSYGRDPVAP